VFTVKDGALPIVKNLEDYAGIENHQINGISIWINDVSALQVDTHEYNRGWLNWSNHHIGNILDAIKLRPLDVDYSLKYRVSPINDINYYDWVIDTKDYAGVFGRPIDKVQIYAVPKQ
jgi:hypothetical protein